MKSKFLILLLATLFTLTHAITGEQILEKMDANRDYKTITFQGIMTIHIGDQVRVKNMTVQGLAKKNRSITEFTNPEDEGTKFLMIEKNLWIYFPEEEDVVKISGHMLKEGMMGSDVSYEDALESDKLTEKYNIKVLGDEKYKERNCYVLELTAKVKDAPYFRRKMLVDKEYFLPWKEEMFAKSGKLLKEMIVLEIEKIRGRQTPTKVEMVNKLRKNSKTIFEMKKLEYDKPMDEKMFSLRYLQR